MCTITEQFIEVMRSKGWSCTDPDELQFCKVLSLEDLCISIAQVDYSDKSVVKDGHLVTPQATSAKELEESLVTDEFHFSCFKTLKVGAELLDVYDIDDYSKVDLLSVVAEREFESAHQTIAPNRMAG